jgi:hypothetical protein
MTTATRLALTLVLAVSAAVATARVAAAGPPEPQVPADIAVPEGNKLFLVAHAVGVQIYTCLPTATGFAWSFVAPRASLYDDRGNLVVTHFAGPSWQAKDGSAVVGTVTGRATVDAAAIPWLRLETTPAPGSKPGRLARTTFIQRIATRGGLAPAPASCNAAAAGTSAEIPYTADYAFWKPHGN